LALTSILIIIFFTSHVLVFAAMFIVSECTCVQFLVASDNFY